MLTNIPSWILWFSTPDYKEPCAFVVAAEIQDDPPPGWKQHVKDICNHTERPIGINGAACSRGLEKCVFVCGWEWGSMFGLGQTHLFPSRMDLLRATGQGADRFIRVVISGCPVTPSAAPQLPGLQRQQWWAPGGRTVQLQRCRARTCTSHTHVQNVHRADS